MMRWFWCSVVGHGILWGLVSLKSGKGLYSTPRLHRSFTVGVVPPKRIPRSKTPPSPGEKTSSLGDKKASGQAQASSSPPSAPLKKPLPNKPVQNPKARPKPQQKTSKTSGSAAKGHSFQGKKKTPALTAYHIQWMHQRFRQFWRMPLNLSPQCHVDVEVHISAQGTVAGVKILPSSTQTHPQFSLMRQTVLRALYQAVPYETFLRNRTFHYRFQRG